MPEFNYNLIETDLLLGQKIDTQEMLDALIRDGVTHVINLWSGKPEPHWQGAVLTLSQEDDGTPRPLDQTRAGVAFAAECKRVGGKLYVHCQWGLGRAPSMTYAILRSRGYTREAAITAINTARQRSAGNWEHYILSIEQAFVV